MITFSRANDRPYPVEIVIACHNERRQVDRAVASVLDGNGSQARVTVVCHNIAPEKISHRLMPAHRDRVRLLSLSDNIASPAGPFNLGLTQAISPWVGIMGSDDHLQPGAVRQWLRQTHTADAVITRLARPSSDTVPTPPVRPLPRHRHAARDRLFYRSAPLGIMRTQFIRDRNLSMTPGLPTGEDLEFSARLWVEGRIKVQRRGPGYVIGEDAEDRVTMTQAAVRDELAHLHAFWESPWVSHLDDPSRQALGTKYLRIHIFGAAYYRTVNNTWTADDHRALGDSSRLILSRAPQAATPLSIADRRLLDALMSPDASADSLSRLALARRRFGTPATLLPHQIIRSLDREAPLRFMAASLLTTIFGRIP